MGNGGTTAWPIRPDRPIGGDELARGLTLVRASALKMARLQVAMERRDRKLVLETMDDLVSLDGEIRDFVDQIPRSDDEIDLLQCEVDEQRAALAREKLALVAGVSRRQFRQLPVQPEWKTEAPLRAQVPDTDCSPVVRPGNAEAEHEAAEEWPPAHGEKAPREWRAPLLAMALVLCLFAALAGAAWLLVSEDPRTAPAALLQALGG